MHGIPSRLQCIHLKHFFTYLEEAGNANVETATPLANGYVKAKTGDDTTDTVYKDWYKNVYLLAPESGGSEETAVTSETTPAASAANSMKASADASGSTKAKL